MTTLILKTGTTPGEAPVSLLPGEPAVDVASGALRMWVGDAAGDPQLVGGVVGPNVDHMTLAGADMTGGVDAAALLQARIDALAAGGGGQIIIAPGTLRLDSTINLPSRVWLDFQNTEIDASALPLGDPLFLANGTAERITDIALTGVLLATLPDPGTGTERSMFLNIRRVSRVLLDRVNTLNGRLIVGQLRDDFPRRTASGLSIYDLTPANIGTGDAAEAYMAEELNFDVTITNFSALGLETSNYSSGVGSYLSVRYIERFAVKDGLIRWCRSGVHGGGGDANPNRDGGIGVRRWGADGTVENVVAADCSAGGIWFGMAQDVGVTNCYTYRCRDYGLHTEGCRGVTFTGCHDTNSLFCMGSYFKDEQVHYEGCHILVDDPRLAASGEGSPPVVFKQNNGFATDGLSVSWRGGSIIVRNVESVDDLGVITTQFGGSIVFEDTLFEGVRIDTSGNNTGRREMRNVTLRYGEDPGGAFDAITVGDEGYGNVEVGLLEPGWIIDNVRTELGFTPAAGSAFIDATVRSGRRNQIINNVQTGFPIFLRTRAVAVSGKTIYMGNNMRNAASIVDDNAAGNGPVTIRYLPEELNGGTF